jgi:hypothetical protein
MSKFVHLAAILSLAACGHAQQTPPTTPPPVAQPAPAQPQPVPAIAPAQEAAVPAADEQPAPKPEDCRMTRAGTCWGQKPKVRVTKTPADAAKP